MKRQHRKFNHRSQRSAAHDVCGAIKTLAGLGVDILFIEFKTTGPVIELAQGEKLFISKSQERGISHCGQQFFLKKQAHVCGCAVNWSEQI